METLTMKKEKTSPNKQQPRWSDLGLSNEKLTTMYRSVESPRDLPQITLDQISHFFAHYKDLEPGKFVKINGWFGQEEAKKEIMEGVARYQESSDKPNY